MSKYEGVTVDEAIQNGLQALNLTKNQVEVTVLDEGKKGFLGFGKKYAIVELTPIHTGSQADGTEPVTTVTTSIPVSTRMSPTPQGESLSDDEAITELAIYLTEITKALAAPALVKVERSKQGMTFQLENNKPGLLIGKHGKVLNALQYLAQVFIHRLAKNKLSVIVNVGDYRERRAASLERLALNTAAKVKKTGQPVFLEPMPAFERKQIHALLTNYTEIATYSEGEEPFRYLVVEKKKD